MQETPDRMDPSLTLSVSLWKAAPSDGNAGRDGLLAAWMALGPEERRILVALLLAMPYTCADLDRYAASPAEVMRHVTITIGALRRSCGWSAHDADRRMDAEDLVCEALWKLRASCGRQAIDDLFAFMATTLQRDVVRFCQKAQRRVSTTGVEDRLAAAPEPELGEEERQRLVACVRDRLADPRDRVLFDLYVEGRPNRAMRQVDDRSERQITRLRGRFADLLKECHARLDR